jgi:hypothetical protein
MGDVQEPWGLAAMLLVPFWRPAHELHAAAFSRGQAKRYAA